MSEDIMVKVIDDGEGSLAEMGSVVSCSFRCFLYSFENNSKKLVETQDNQSFKIGEGDCIPALELSLRHSKNNSAFHLKCRNKFAYGSLGRPGVENGNIEAIPPDTDLYFEVYKINHSYGSALSSEYDNDKLKEPVEEIKLRRECGNRWFSFKDYLKAGRAYSKGIQIAEATLNALGEEDRKSPLFQTINENFLSCLNNLAASYLSSKEFTKCKEVCIRVLEIQPTNSKALLRAAKAALALDNYEECQACLDRLKELDPNDAQAEKERIKLKQAQKVYRDQAKKLATAMSKKLFSSPPPSETLVNEPFKEGDEKNEVLKLKEAEVTEDRKTGSEAVAGSKTEASAGQSASRNGVLLLSTSLFVIIVSIVIVVVINNQTKSSLE